MSNLEPQLVMNWVQKQQWTRLVEFTMRNVMWLCKVIFSLAPRALWIRRWADSAKCSHPSVVVTQTLYVLKLSLYVRYILFKGNNEHEITGRLGPSRPEALTTRREVEEMKREEREATRRIPSVVKVSFNHCFSPSSPHRRPGGANTGWFLVCLIKVAAV